MSNTLIFSFRFLCLTSSINIVSLQTDEQICFSFDYTPTQFHYTQQLRILILYDKLLTKIHVKQLLFLANNNGLVNLCFATNHLHHKGVIKTFICQNKYFENCVCIDDTYINTPKDELQLNAITRYCAIVTSGYVSHLNEL